jgi:hypothetical protein
MNNKIFLTVLITSLVWCFVFFHLSKETKEERMIRKYIEFKKGSR